jgi:hypothetical protein
VLNDVTVCVDWQLSEVQDQLWAYKRICGQLIRACRSLAAGEVSGSSVEALLEVLDSAELVVFVCSQLICLRAKRQYTCPLSLLYSLEQGYTKQLQQLELSLNGNGDYQMQLRARSLEVRSP